MGTGWHRDLREREWRVKKGWNRKQTVRNGDSGASGEENLGKTCQVGLNKQV